MEGEIICTCQVPSDPDELWDSTSCQIHGPGGIVEQNARDEEGLELVRVSFTEIPVEAKIAILREMGFKTREGYIFDERSETEWQVVPRSQEAPGDAIVLTWHEDA